MLLLACLGGCDLPSGLPTFETEWTVPAAETVIPPSELVPAGMGFTADGTRWTAPMGQTLRTRSLQDLCTGCAGVAGQRALKPAFVSTVELALPLPDGLVGGTVVGGSVNVELTNTLGFDPLRPGLSAVGSAAISVLVGSTTIGAATLSGTATALPSGGAPVNTSVPLTGGTVTGDSLRVRVVVTSPLGAPTQIALDRALSVRASATPLTFSAGSIDLTGRTLDLTPVLLQVRDVGGDASRRIGGGTLQLTVANPLGRQLALTMRVQGGGFETVTKTATIPATPTSTTDVPFTGDELRRFLGAPTAQLRGTLTVDGSGAVELSPSDRVDLSTTWIFGVSVGG